MEQLIRDIALETDYFLLMFIRCGALIVSSPIFGRRNIPNIAKISFVLSVTVLFYIAFPKTAPLEYSNMMSYSMLALTEFLLGVVMGYVTTLFFSLVYTAGQTIDMQMGFGMVNVFDVQSNGNIPVSGNLLNIIMLIVFFAVNGHHRLFLILYTLMERIPVGHATVGPQIGMAAAEAFSIAFVLGLNVAMPLIASGMLGEVGLGLIVRTVPQMNVFVVGIPIKILLGFLMMIFVIPIYVNYCNIIFDQLFISMESMFGSMMSEP